MGLNTEIKAQGVRLLDVFVLGPGMVYAATLIPDEHKLTRVFLCGTGVATILYNWRNYKRIAKAG